MLEAVAPAMPDLPILLSFVVAAFVVVIVPGITVSAVVSTALARGFVAGMWFELGVQFGRLSMVVIVAVALEAVTSFVGAAFDIIKYAGAAYLVWIGIGYLRSTRTVDTTRTYLAATTPLRQIVSGFVVLWGNPKALIFALTAFPQENSPALLGYFAAFAATVIAAGGGWIVFGRLLKGAAGSRAGLIPKVAAVALVGFAGFILRAAI